MTDQQKDRTLKSASSIELFRELQSRTDVLAFKAGIYMPYDVQPKYGAKPLTEDNAPISAIAIREDVLSDIADS